MSNEKLIELIKLYGMAVARLVFDSPPENVDKARQAIIDYHDKNVAKAYCEGYNKAEGDLAKDGKRT